jgi:hypothetical protein
MLLQLAKLQSQNIHVYTCTEEHIMKPQIEKAEYILPPLWIITQKF